MNLYNNIRQKRFFFITILISIGIYSYSQKLGIGIGLNSSTLIDSENSEQKDIIGFNAGFVAEFPKNPIKKFLLSEFCLLVCTKGTKKVSIYDRFNMSQQYYYSVTSITISKLPYMEAQLRLKPSLYIKKTRIYGSIGPYLAMGIGCNIKYKSALTNNPKSVIDNFKYKVKWGDGVGDDFKKVDYGFIVGIGIEREKIQLCTFIEKGVRNIKPPNIAGFIAKSYCLNPPNSWT